MKKTNSWIITLFSLLFIACPGVGIYFFAFDLIDGYLYKALISFGYLFFCLLICFLCIFFKLFSIEIITFAVPLSFVFFSLLMTYGLEPWIVALITLPMILISIPCNRIVFNLNRKKQKTNKKV